MVWSSIEKWSSKAPRGYSDVCIVSGSIHTVKKNTEALIAAGEEIDLTVNAEEAKHVVMSCGLQAGQNDNITTVHKSFERVEQVKYWEQH